MRGGLHFCAVRPVYRREADHIQHWPTSPPAQGLHCALRCETRSVMQQVRRNAVADAFIDNS